ncbi:MAG TPA: site-2 protease family protein [Candidatus Sulfomarinibacteraceae bacterium]|nr:site-2 protease family protein [Candidatus Sulfomarinibacteraceae bacterium]
MLFFGFDIATIIAFVITATLAFAYHEFAHAIVADRMGDHTPRSYGRITLNPFVHLDMFGMLMLLLAGFGWATTPVNPNNLRGNPRTSMAIVAIAGPLANLLMAIIWAVPIRSGLLTPAFAPREVSFALPTLFQLCYIGVQINLLLFAFNLMPIPPLDGFTILMGILPPEMAYQLTPIRQYGTLILLAVIFILPRIGLDVLGWFISPVLNNVMPLLLG